MTPAARLIFFPGKVAAMASEPSSIVVIMITADNSIALGIVFSGCLILLTCTLASSMPSNEVTIATIGTQL